MIVTANVLVAETDEEADFQAGPGRLMAYRIRSGRFGPLLSPEAAAAQADMVMAANVPTNLVTGSPPSALAQLDRLLSTTGADELMVTTVAYGLDTRLRSLELRAEAWLRTPSDPS